MMPFSPARQNTKMGQPMNVNRSVVLPLIMCCPQYANEPYTEAMQVGQSITGLARFGNRLMKSQRSSSPIMPSAVDSHRPKINSEVKSKVSIMGLVLVWSKVVKLPECFAWSGRLYCFAKSTARIQRVGCQSARSRQCHRYPPQRATNTNCCR